MRDASRDSRRASDNERERALFTRLAGDWGRSVELPERLLEAGGEGKIQELRANNYNVVAVAVGRRASA